MDTKNYNNDQLKAVKQLTYALCRLIESCEPKQYNTTTAKCIKPFSQCTQSPTSPCFAD